MFINDHTGRIAKRCYQLTLPFVDIYTSVFLIKTDEGAILYDTGSDSDDAEKIIAFLEDMLCSLNDVKYIFLSHTHKDHAGGLEHLCKHLKNAAVLSKSAELKARYPDFDIRSFEDGDEILDNVFAVTVPGHTLDSAAIYDRLSECLITGDCLQYYGVISRVKNYPVSILHPYEYFEAVEKLEKLDALCVYASHDYFPAGRCAKDRISSKTYIRDSVRPVKDMLKLIEEYPDKSDEELAAVINGEIAVELIDSNVFKKLRKAITKGEE